MELGLTPSTARRRSILAWTSLLAPALRFMRPVTAILVGRGGLVDMAIWSKSITAAGTRRALGIFLGEWRSEERRVGKECVSRVDLGGRRIIKKKSQDKRGICQGSIVVSRE